VTFPSRTTSLAATATATVASALAYPFLSDQVATHFDDEGRPDRYGSRVAAAVAFPAIMAGLTIVNDRLGVWPGSRDWEDGTAGVQVRDQAIGLVNLALLPPHLAVLAHSLGVPVGMNRMPRVVYGVLMIGLGNVMPKLPRNGLVGIRTPWTLADPAVWERTHRVGGYLVTAAGLVSLASLPASGKRAAQLPTAAVLSAVGLSAVYSFVIYSRRKR
jgi:uncharacterized membrane protein